MMSLPQSMPRLEKDTIKETIPQTALVGFLQVCGYKCTPERESVAKVLDENWKALTLFELKEETALPRMTLHRILKTFQKEGLVHHSPSFNAYFACKRVMQARRRTSCHSFSICESCKAVQEFVHEKHAHPKFKNFQVQTREHEWLGLCTRCRLQS